MPNFLFLKEFPLFQRQSEKNKNQPTNQPTDKRSKLSSLSRLSQFECENKISKYFLFGIKFKWIASHLAINLPLKQKEDSRGNPQGIWISFLSFSWICFSVIWTYEVLLSSFSKNMFWLGKSCNLHSSFLGVINSRAAFSNAS